MATTTVIDQLVIKLGLDPRDFTKGEKQVAADVLKTQQTVEHSSSAMGSNLAKLAGRWLTVAAAVAVVKKAAGFIDDVATRTRQLGIDAKNYDIAADKLRNFENAIQMMGGSAEDAHRTVGGFQKAIFDLAYNGQVSDSLVMLTRLGVQFQTATGQARGFNDIVLDTADAIAKAQQNGMSRGNAFQFLQQAGFDPGTANAILAGRGAIQTELNRQQNRIQVNPDALAAANHVATSRIDKEQQIEAFGVAELGGGAGNAQAAINEAIAHPAEALHKLGDAASHAGTWLESMALRAAGTTRGLRNNNPGNIRAVGGQLSDREGFAVYATMEEGVQKAQHQLDLYAKRGIVKAKDIIGTYSPAAAGNDVPAYLRDIQKDTGIKPDDVVGEQDRAAFLAAMFKHESGKKAPDAGTVADILQMQGGSGAGGGALDTPATPGAAATTFNKTEVHIENMEVNTQAKDADSIAGSIDDSLQRKLMASHAETGLQ